MITRVKGSYVIGYNGADHEIIRDGEVVYENDTIIYVGKHYEGEVSRQRMQVMPSSCLDLLT